MGNKQDFDDLRNIKSDMSFKFVSTVSFFACVFLAIWIARGFLINDFNNITLYLSCFIVYLTAFIINKYTPQTKLASILLLITLAIFSIYLFNTATYNSNSYLWCLALPIIIVMLLPESHVVIANIAYISILFLTYIFIKPDHHSLLRKDALLRFVLVYLTILINSFVTIKNKNHVFKKAEHISKTDTLTNLYNRRIMCEIPSIINGENVVIMLLDIDTFKKYNDSYGHIKGDHVLAKIGSILTNEKRCSDIAIRYGGEEFLLVFNNTTLEEILPRINAIKKSLHECNIVHEASPFGQLTASIGIAKSNSGIRDIGDFYRLIDESDAKMYTVKQNGGNGIAY